MGFQMRIWSCVPRCPQMPPPHYPQVQILRRRNALCGLKDSEGGEEGDKSQDASGLARR